jgi:hypothetical protein
MHFVFGRPVTARDGSASVGLFRGDVISPAATVLVVCNEEMTGVLDDVFGRFADVALDEFLSLCRIPRDRRIHDHLVFDILGAPLWPELRRHAATSEK